MKEKGRTIAVLGSGFNHIYPEENINLVKEIIKNGGAIISEYPPNTEVNLSNFPIRNRIIAGIANSTIVVEAKYRSGSSVTARHSIMQGKKVYCVPGRIGDKTGRGTNNLIGKGAHILTDINEILIELGEETGSKEKIKSKVIEEYVEDKFINNTKTKEYKLFNNKIIEKNVWVKSVRNIKEEYQILSKGNKKQIQYEEERKNNKKKKIKKEYSEIYELISKSPINIDEIARILNINIAEVNMKLTMMEIEELIEVLPGNIIKIQE